MKSFLAAAAAVVGVLTVGALASAQGGRALTDMSVDMYRACYAVARNQTQVTTPEQACACMTGYMGAAMSDRDFDIASRLARIGSMVESGAPATEVNSELAAFYAEGYTDADAQRVAGLIEAMSTRGDAICTPFYAPPPTI